MLNRFNLKELTPQRLASATLRRIQDIPHRVAWNSFNPVARQNKQRLLSYKNRHAGERCFIIANGPSLKTMDLSGLKDEVTIGMNRIYLLFDQIPFRTTYYICINELVLEEFASDIRQLSMPKFLNWDRRELFEANDPNTLFMRYSLGLRDLFGIDPTHIQYAGGTVTYCAMQLAYYMGFKSVILIGLDHNYVEKGIPNKVEVRQESQDESHFHPDYFPKGVRWQLPDLLRSEVAYQLARDVFTQDGRQILDATPHGKCPIFEKVEFSQVLNADAISWQAKE